MPKYEDYLKSLNYKYNNAEEIINNRISGLKKDIEELKQNVNQLIQVENKQKLKISSLLSEKNTLQNEKKNLNNQLVTAKKNYDSLFQEIGNISDNANKSEKQIKQLQNEKEEQRTEYINQIHELNKAKSELEKKLQDSNSEYSREEIKKLQTLYQTNQKLITEYKKKEELLNCQIEKEQNALKDYKGNIKFYLWVIGIVCIGFFCTMIYYIFEKENYSRLYEKSRNDYIELDNLFDNSSDSSALPYAIGDIDFYNTYTEKYGTKFKKSETTYVGLRVKEFYCLNPDSITISYKYYRPSGKIATYDGKFKDGVVNGTRIFIKNRFDKYYKNIKVGRDWGHGDVNSWSVGDYEYYIYVNHHLIKKATLTITAN